MGFTNISHLQFLAVVVVLTTLLIFPHPSEGASYSVTSYFASGSCASGTLTGFDAVQVPSCPTPSSTGPCTTFAASGASQTSCVDAVPSIPSSPLFQYTMEYNTSSTCSGDPGRVTAFLDNTCVQTGAMTSVKWACSLFKLSATSYSNGACSTFGVTAEYATNKCTAESSGTASRLSSPFCSPGPAVCFHEDTRITYQSYPEVSILEVPKITNGECVIPHRFSSHGIRIQTTCGQDVILTPDHLVFVTASDNLIPAQALRLGDKLQPSHCVVTGVFAVPAAEFVGLNCLHSQVYANGMLTSTFGHYHTLPSLWMKLAGKLFGVQKASATGDWLASLAVHLGLL